LKQTTDFLLDVYNGIETFINEDSQVGRLVNL